MGKSRYLFKKVRDIKGKFQSKMGSIKDRNGIIVRIGKRSPERRWPKDPEGKSPQK